MSEPCVEPHPGHSSTLLEWIDAIADQFEAAWKQGPAPSIASFVGTETGARRSDLLAELVKIDLEYRWRSGDRRQLADYLAEFPDLLGPDGALPDHLLLHARRLRERFAGEADPGKTVIAPRAAQEERTLGLRCPHCGNPIAEVPSESRDVTCSSCGGSFRVEAGSGTVFRSADLPRPLGKFQLLELLGRGSFGSVYKARDALLDRVVAIKVPRTGYFATPEEEQRFLREGRSAAQLVHPHIVQIHDIAYEGAMPYLVCDFIAGRTLAEQLAEQRPSFRESAELAAQTADALDYAHRHQVIHRDVNPRNILIDAAGQPHVADFGLARRDEGSVAVTVDGQVLGTPAYMAPEQAAGEQSKVDGRSDVYSLGVILYELLTGERPFRGSMRMLLHQVIHDEPRPPRRLNDRIPRDLQTICLKAMAKSPARRYQTAGDLAADLRRYLNGEPIQARPVGNAERLWRWCRRNPLVASLTGAVAGLLIAVAVVATVAAARRAQLAEERSALADERSARAEKERDLAKHHLEQTQEMLSQSQAAQGVQSLEAGNTGGLLHLLKAREMVRDIPYAQDSRAVLCSGWRSVCARRLEQVLGHDAGILQVAFSPPDGRLVASIASDGTVRLWETATGRLQGPTLRCRPIGPGQRFAMAFSPDGKRLAVVSGEGTVRLWDTATGQAIDTSIEHFDPKTKNGITRLAFSPDGNWLATATDEEVRLWNTRTWERHGPSMHHGEHAISEIAFSPNGELLVTGTSWGRAQLWETSTSKPRGFPMQHGRPGQHDIHIAAVAFSPDSKLLATASWDDTARLWDTATGEPRGVLLHQEDVWDVAFSPDGKLVATASFDNTAQLWDAATGKPHGPPLRHEGNVLGVAFSPDGKLLATGSSDTTARLWDTDTGQPHGLPLRHQGQVRSVVFSRDGTRLATASADHTARLWKVTAGATDPEPLHHQDRVWTVAFSPDGKRLATGSEDGTAWLWDLATRKRLADSWQEPSILAALATCTMGLTASQLGQGPLPAVSALCPGNTGHPHQILSVAFSPDGKLLALIAAPHIQFLDTATWQSSGEPLAHDGVRAFAFSPDGKLLASGGTDRTARLWEVATRQPHRVRSLQHQDAVWAVAFSPKGRRLLATGSGDRTAKLWDPETGEQYGLTLPHEEVVVAVAFSPDGSLLATSSRDLTVRLWETATGQPHGRPFQHQAMIRALAFSPDGKRLATASDDGTARLWDLETGLLCGPVLHHDFFATAVAFSPDGNWLATASFDQTARLWPVPALVADLEEMKLRTWLALGAWDTEQGVQPIPWQEWQALRQQLRALEARRGAPRD
jgi:WD40 repeat protein